MRKIGDPVLHLPEPVLHQTDLLGCFRDVGRPHREHRMGPLAALRDRDQASCSPRQIDQRRHHVESGTAASRRQSSRASAHSAGWPASIPAPRESPPAAQGIPARVSATTGRPNGAKRSGSPLALMIRSPDLRSRARNRTREKRLPAEHEQRLVAAAHAAGLAAGEDDADCVRHRSQNSPTILPSAPTSMASAAGTFGRPGIVMISPQIATTNSAPADSRTSRTLIV